MPKIKSHRGAAKRFKKTAGGKIKFSHAFRSHLLGHKSAGRKRKLRKQSILSLGDAKRMRRVLP